MTNRLSRVLFSVAILVAATASANEPEWQEVMKDAEVFAEVDTANIQVRENKLTAWVRITRSQGVVDRDSSTRSVILLKVFDCEAKKSGISSMTAFTGPRGTGEIGKTVEGQSVGLANLQDERPATNGYKILEFVCAQVQRANVKETESVESPRPASPPARITSVVDPSLYYPPGAKRRLEQGAPVVMACIGPDGNLVREPVITETSGFAEIDLAAVKVAKANRYSPGPAKGPALPESCVKFRVKFVVTNN